MSRRKTTRRKRREGGSRRRRNRRPRTISDRKIRAIIHASRNALARRGASSRLSPTKRRKLQELSRCTSCRQARRIIQRGGILPLLPLLAAAAPLIAKAALGVGAAAAGAAITRAINKK